MPRFRHIQNSFRGGEVSPNVFARTDTELYKTSVETLTNKIVKTQGGAVRRPGSQFLFSSLTAYNISTGVSLGATSYGSDKVKILPFIYSQDDAYAIMLTAKGSSSSIAIVRTSDQTVCTFGISARVTSDRVTGIEVFDGYDVESELDELSFTQSGDLFFIAHANYNPIVIARTGATTFERRVWYEGISPGDFSKGWPFLIPNTDGSQFLEITGLGGTNMTSTSALFTADHVGSVFKLTADGVTNNFFITGFTNSTTVTGSSGNSTVASGPFGPTFNWEESAFSPERGWPRAVTLYEQRLYYGGTEHQPNTVHASQIGDLFELDSLGYASDTGFGTTSASDPFNFTVASQEVNQIQWMSGGATLQIGTLGREYIAQGGQGALSATDISVTPESSYGSAYRQPIRNENTLLFISKTGTKVREFVFNRDESSFRGDDLTRWSAHMLLKNVTAGDLSPEIVFLARQETDDTIVWCLDSNGALFATTRDRIAQTNAFHYHSIAGSDVVIKSIASLPNEDGTEDDLWIAVERTVNSSTVTYLEKIGVQFRGDEPKNSSSSIRDKMVYSDSCKFTYNASAFTVVSGLTHLEGETVVAVGDGSYMGEFTVASGSITLPIEVNDVVVGLNYTSEIKTLRVDEGSALQTSQAAIKRVDRVAIRFTRTIHAEYGSEEGKLEEFIFNDPTLAADQAVPLFTGDKISEMPQTYEESGTQLIIRQNQPLPMEVSGIVMRGLTYD